MIAKLNVCGTLHGAHLRKSLALAALSAVCVFALACSQPGAEGTGTQSGSQQSKSADSVAPESGNPTVVMKTSKGQIEIELLSDKAPATVENFLTYADDGHYDGTIFHRIIDGFMIQGGGFAKSLQQKPTRPPVKNEANNGMKNTRGTLAMARTSVPDSATAQFFINDADNAFLDFKAPTAQGYGYAVFGRVVSGMDVVDAISSTPTRNQGGGFANMPVEPVVIESVRRKN